MVELLQILLLILAIALSLSGVGFKENSRFIGWARALAAKPRLAIAAIICATLVGCLAVAGLIHEPVSRIHDEFSYLLMSDTLASGHAANPSPPLTEFFDTFHELIRPVYASKYFVAQGVFLALGQKLTGHPAVGVWLSSALACAAAFWMLQAWITPAWALFGSILMVVQFGIFSYWSQSYWGGMVAALGGALFFGAIRRLWDRFSWQNAFWLGLGLVILVNSRPIEGAVAALPITLFFLWHIWRERQWKQGKFWGLVVLPAAVVLALGATATGAYNRAITGSVWKPAYVVHEQQYQESPQFVFMPLRPKITYSSWWLQYYYEVYEMRNYLSQRTPKNLLITTAGKIYEWWDFYCGFLLGAPLFLIPLLRPGRLRYWQLFLILGFIVTAFAYDTQSVTVRIAIDVLALAEIVVLWCAFDDIWSRLAIATCALVVFESLFVKWTRPHYVAPIACLVLFLQVEALRRIWHWRDYTAITTSAATRNERRRAARSNNLSRPFGSRIQGFVLLLPLACVISIGVQLGARLSGWEPLPTNSFGRLLPVQDWSMQRAELERWLEKQPSPQLVFVRYGQHHNVIFEWVFNHADLMHSHVIWAHDLGTEHNRLLLNQLRDRTIWMLDADQQEPQLVPYAESAAPRLIGNGTREQTGEQ